MSDSNTIAGWVLGAGIVALGSSILFGEVFHSAPAHGGKQGYVIHGVEASGDGGAAVEVPVATALAAAVAADGVAKGETIFKKCVSCHTINAGGAAGIGPNLNAILGKGIASSAFAYSPALKAKGGNWSFESMNEWLKSPKKFVPDNKMTFAGIGKAEERAALMLYLNSQGSNLPLPAPEAAPAEGAADAAAPAAAGEAAAAEAPKK
jgi:cytochrome c